MTLREALESYVNGNIGYVKSWLEDSGYTLGQFLEYYIEEYDPDKRDIVLFVKRLSK